MPSEPPIEPRPTAAPVAAAPAAVTSDVIARGIGAPDVIESDVTQPRARPAAEQIEPSSERAPVAVADTAAGVALGAGRERRLHPFSWLFVLLAQLRSFALPLIALLFFGRGDSWELLGLVAAAVLTGLAVVQYYTYRFRIDGNELVIRSGLIHRNVRHMPLARIQNVALRRNPLHRMFGVAEVKLESAVGGVAAEAQMRVLSMRDAAALETLVRASRHGAVLADAGGESASEADDLPQGDLLLALPVTELIKLGLTSNRGLVLGAAGLGVLAQFNQGGMKTLFSDVGRAVFGYASGLHLGWLQWAVLLPVLLLAVVLVLRLVSVALTVLQFHGFRLTELDQRLSVEGGLLTRIRSNAPLRKIQHWTLRESWLLRRFGRRSLKVETAVMQMANEAQGLSDLAPIAPPSTVDALLARWLPWLRLDTLDWQPIHPAAWRRMAFWPLLLTVIVCVPLVWNLGAWGLLPLLSLPFWLWRARRLAAGAGWAVTDRVLAWRSGWLDRRVSFAEITKLQGLQLSQSPFDRRRGMASLSADTAGANPLGHRLELTYLPEATARALHARLAPQIARSALAW